MQFSIFPNPSSLSGPQERNLRLIFLCWKVFPAHIAYTLAHDPILKAVLSDAYIDTVDARAEVRENAQNCIPAHRTLQFLPQD